MNVNTQRLIKGLDPLTPEEQEQMRKTLTEKYGT
jgi:hypothetical protein